MTTLPDDDADVALRTLLHAPHIDEGGFSERVIASLPAKRVRKRSRRNLAIVGGALAAGLCGAIGAAAVQTSLPFGAVLPFAVVVLAVVVGLVEADARA